VLSQHDGCRSAVALLLKAALIQVSDYRLLGASGLSTQLQIVDNAKYLGLTISKNLSWNNHVNNITKKANSTLAFLRRNIRNCPQRAKIQAYNTFVRPSLEYASTVWDPHTQANINKVESIQRRVARFVTNNYDPRASVTTLLQDLNWPTL
jgi:hypothetical protein